VLAGTQETSVKVANQRLILSAMSDDCASAGSPMTQALSPVIIRRLSWTERLFWLLDQNRPRHFVMAAHVAGHTTADQWRKALDAVQRRHPLLSAGIAVVEDSAPCFYRAAIAPIPLRVVQGEDVGRDWKAEFARELALPFDPEQVPLLRAVLLQEPGRAVCILSTHHAIGDGMSIAFVVRDLLQALTGTTLRPLPALPALDELVGQRATGRARQAIAAALGPAAPGPPSRYRERDGAVPQIRFLQLGPEFTDCLRERAREEGASVHGALCSGLALSYAQVHDRPASEPIRIWSPIDVRKLLGLGDDCAVLATSRIVTAEPGGLPGFWGVARAIAARLEATRTVAYLTAALTLLSQTINGLDVAAAAQLMAQRFSFDFVLTNLGVLPYQTRFGDLKLEKLLGPAVLSGFEGEHVFGAATTGGKLSLTYSSYPPIDSLLERLEQTLIAACHQP
jgi:hypothetical protein